MGPLIPMRARLTLGRQPFRGLCLVESHISERHCTVVAKGSRALLRDAGSEYGTFVNGRRVERHRLAPGDFVELGNAGILVVNPNELHSPISDGVVGIPKPACNGPAVHLGPLARAHLFGSIGRDSWFTLEGVLAAASTMGPPRTVFICTASWSAGAFSSIALGHIIGERSPRSLRIVVGDPGPEAGAIAQRLMVVRGCRSLETMTGIVRSPQPSADLPPLHAKFILLALSSGVRLAIVGSSNASFAGYIENWELNVGFSWRFGDPYGLEAVAEDLWRRSEPLRVENQIGEGSTLGGRLKPHGWQRSRIHTLRALWQAARRKDHRPVHELTGYTLEMPPATGKTLIAVEFSRSVLEAGGRVLWLAHRRVLLTQASLTLSRQFGSSHWVRELPASIASSHFDPPCICLATDAMLARQLTSVARHAFDVVVVDEVHRYGAARYQATFRRLRAKLLLGLSATPARRGRGLHRAEFERRFPSNRSIDRLPMSLAFRLSEHGAPVLAHVRHVSFDTGWVMKVASDDPWSLEAQEKRRLGEFSRHFTTVVLAVLEALLTRYQSELGPFGPTLVFATDIAHAQRLHRGLTALLAAIGRPVWIKQYHSGIPVHIRGRTRHAELAFLREEFLSRSRSGECPILIGVDIVAEGFDVPAVQTLVMSRPTVSLRLYAQMIGRGLRGPAMGGGDYCNLLHFGAQTEIGGQRMRSFVDVRDVLTGASSRVESLGRLERLLRCDDAEAPAPRRRRRWNDKGRAGGSCGCRVAPNASMSPLRQESSLATRNRLMRVEPVGPR